MKLRKRNYYSEGVLEFDTKMRRAIESSLDKLHSLSKRKDDDKAREYEQEALEGLKRLVKQDPVKFMYSVLEIFGVRGKYKSQKYGIKKEVED